MTFLRHVFVRRAATPILLPHKPRSNIMSLSAVLSNLNIQDDDQLANVMAEALNSDQRIRALQGLPIAWDAAGLRRVANALAAHAVGLEAEIGRTAPRSLPKANGLGTQGEHP